MTANEDSGLAGTHSRSQESDDDGPVRSRRTSPISPREHDGPRKRIKRSSIGLNSVPKLKEASTSRRRSSLLDAIKKSSPEESYDNSDSSASIREVDLSTCMTEDALREIALLLRMFGETGFTVSKTKHERVDALLKSINKRLSSVNHVHTSFVSFWDDQSKFSASVEILLVRLPAFGAEIESRGARAKELFGRLALNLLLGLKTRVDEETSMGCLMDLENVQAKLLRILIHGLFSHDHITFLTRFRADDEAVTEGIVSSGGPTIISMILTLLIDLCPLFFGVVKGGDFPSRGALWDLKMSTETADNVVLHAVDELKSFQTPCQLTSFIVSASRAQGRHRDIPMQWLNWFYHDDTKEPSALTEGTSSSLSKRVSHFARGELRVRFDGILNRFEEIQNNNLAFSEEDISECIDCLQRIEFCLLSILRPTLSDKQTGIRFCLDECKWGDFLSWLVRTSPVSDAFLLNETFRPVRSMAARICTTSISLISEAVFESHDLIKYIPLSFDCFGKDRWPATYGPVYSSLTRDLLPSQRKTAAALIIDEIFRIHALLNERAEHTMAIFNDSGEDPNLMNGDLPNSDIPFEIIHSAFCCSLTGLIVALYLSPLGPSDETTREVVDLLHAGTKYPLDFAETLAAQVMKHNTVKEAAINEHCDQPLATLKVFVNYSGFEGLLSVLINHLIQSCRIYILSNPIENITSTSGDDVTLEQDVESSIYPDVDIEGMRANSAAARMWSGKSGSQSISTSNSPARPRPTRKRLGVRTSTKTPSLSPERAERGEVATMKRRVDVAERVREILNKPRY